MAFISLSPHDWMIGIFLFCAVVVFGNGIHYLVFAGAQRPGGAAPGEAGVRKYLARPRGRSS